MRISPSRLGTGLAGAALAIALLTPASSHANWRWKRLRPEPNLVQKLEQAGQYTTLLTALELTGLKDTVATAEALTLFAPTDAAFAALPEGTLESLINDLPALENILLYHVVAGKVTSAKVVELSSAKTVGGKSVRIRVAGSNVFVNRSKVTKADVMASNGVIHVVNRVLIPPA